MKIAIVGAGISGLTAAYLLNRAHDIVLFERGERAGGHAHTIEAVMPDGPPLPLDTGFLVFNEHTYPGFVRLLGQLGVRHQPSDMSISVRCAACRMEYSSRGLAGMLAQRSNALRPARAMLALDILRFYRDVRRELREPAHQGQTLGAFLRARRYGGEFVRHFIIPLAAAVWSTPTRDIEQFPAVYFLRFLHNHGIIGLQPAYEWRTVAGGSRRYVDAMLRTFPCRTRLSTPVRKVLRDAEGVRLLLADGSCPRFDRVVLACHADEALRLLADPDDGERRALAAFAYTSNHAVLHTDPALLPAKDAVRSSWNYATPDCRRPEASLGMTFSLNRLQAIDSPTQYQLSLNSNGHVRPDTIIAEMTYEHPRYSFAALEGQQALLRMSGERHTFFAGAHLGYGFHEDGLQSGVRVAGAFGIAL